MYNNIFWYNIAIMMIIVISVITIVLFFLSVLSRRRFGTLGLSLTAGALLASTMAKDTSIFMANLEVPTGSIPYFTAAQILLIILPPSLLLLNGPSYSNRLFSVFGSICFALLGTLLLLGPISVIVPYDDQARSFLSFISPYINPTLAILVGLAIIDMWLTHNSPALKTHKKNNR
ncbi:hypothetical protein EOL73_02370 [Candidatus Saccharibacteria bacterium]|nr:hypothetical protein [Candidatus Saccharibacteria bacterium]